MGRIMSLAPFAEWTQLLLLSAPHVLRWQLQAAGKQEERVCRFCQCELPDWRESLTPATFQASTVPVMLVKFEGRAFKLRVYPGPEGLALFKHQVQQVLGLDISGDFDVNFEVRVSLRTHW